MLHAVECHVYVDYKPDGTPFYVGKGSRHRVSKVERNKWHTAIRGKYPNWRRQVVETASEELCREFEVFLISEIGRRDLGRGPLVNLTDGGDGVPGLHHTQETKERCRNIQKGEKGFWYGKLLPEKTRGKISAKFKARGSPNPMAGKKHTPETLRKISSALTGKPLSEETRRKMSTSRKGKKRSSEACEAVSRGKLGSKGTITGKIGVIRDGTYRFIPPSEVETYMANGWKRGRK